MDNHRTEPFGEVLDTIMERSPHEWVYLPGDRNWNVASESATLASEEVSPEEEDDAHAGVPQFAKSHNLIQVINVATLQDVVSNARTQRPSATLDDLFRAFKFYYDRDAFMEL